MCRLVKEINGERKLLDRLPLPPMLKRQTTQQDND